MDAFLIMVAVVFYGVISNFKDLFNIWRHSRMESIIKDGNFIHQGYRYKIERM